MSHRQRHSDPQADPVRAAELSSGPSVVPFDTADGNLWVELGPRVAGLLLGAVIQRGPRRRANGRIPSPRKTDAARRPDTPISLVALGLPPSRRWDRVVAIHVASHGAAPGLNSDGQAVAPQQNEAGHGGAQECQRGAR